MEPLKIIVTYKIAILTTTARCHTFMFFLQTRNYIPCPDGQTATNLTIETMEKIYSLYIEATILEQNQNQKKKKEIGTGGK